MSPSCAMNLLVTDIHLDKLPLFPLPGTVFFPNTLIQLHVFEPRYRALTRHCIDRTWPMAVVQIKPGHEASHLGQPPIAQLASIGHVVMHEQTDDGRYNIVLRGMSRVELIEEHADPELPYRTARAKLVSDYVHPDRPLLQRKVATVLAALTSLAGRDRKIAEMVSGPLLDNRSPAVLADALAAMIFTEPERRQELLACNRVHERLDLVLDRLSELLAVSGASSSPAN